MNRDRQVRREIPACERVQGLCQRSASSDTPGAFYKAFDPAWARDLVRRIEFHLTPKHGSWLNMADNEVSAMTRQCLSGRRIGDLDTLRAEIAAWSTDVNARQRGVDWQMKIGDARRKLKSVYPKNLFWRATRLPRAPVKPDVCR